MTQLVPLDEKRALAAALVRSGLFGLKDEAQAISLMALCEAEGLHPAKAVQEFHIIQGKPARKADAVLARFQAAGGRVDWHDYTTEKVSGTFSHPQGGSVRIEWTIAMAQKIGLAGKDNWKNYPRNMLRARCISEGVRAVFPGVTAGIYTVEEMQDMPAPQIRDMGNVEIVEKPEAPADLLERAKAAAEQGVESYTAFWESISKDERKAIGAGRHADYKAMASEAVVE